MHPRRSRLFRGVASVRKSTGILTPFCHRLAANYTTGKPVSLQAIFSLRAPLYASRTWDFPGDAWSEDADSVIRPPDKRNLHSRAFRTDRAYGDFTAEFEFNGSYRETGTGSAGLVIRAADSNHFYFVWFPWGGQQLRAKHFWAAVAKVDGDGYLRNLAMEWVPGVPSETDRWYNVRVEARQSRIAVWVDGRRALSIEDESYAEGCVGLAGYGWYAFRNVRINGDATAPPAWDSSLEIPANAA